MILQLIITIVLGVCILLIVYLYTARQTALATLRETLISLTLTQYSPHAAPHILVQTNKDGVITEINTDIKTIGQFTPYELIGKSVDILNTRLDDAKSDSMWETLRTLVPYRFEVSGFYKSNVPFSFLLTIVPVLDTKHVVIGYLGIRIPEAVESSHSEELLHASSVQTQAHAEAIIASIAEGVIVTDQHGDITMTNQAGKEMLGITDSEGKSIIEILPLEDEHGAMLLPEFHPVYVALREARAVVTHKYTYVRSDFTKMRLAVTTSPIYTGGSVIGIVTVLRDATLEEQIDRSKTEFVSLASHQLRTPLTAINWYTELLLDQGVDRLTDDQKSFLQQIQASSASMNELVSSLLNVSRLELGTFIIEPALTDIVQLVEEVLAELQVKIVESGHAVEKEFDATLEEIAVDPKLMRIVVQNLLSNAVKYTPPRGTVKIRLYRHYPDMRFEVKDTGYGIPQNQKDKIFTKLFRADNVLEENLEGNGLGLYIVKEILDQSGGAIWFESQQDKGTTFFVSIPLTGMRKKEGTKALI